MPVIQAQLQVMVNTLSELCRTVLPHMQAQGFGRIINVSSLAAFAPPARWTMYSAKLVNQVIAAFSKRLPEAVRYQMGKLNFLE